MSGALDNIDEITDLWGRLDRLKVGIGGWVVTAATMPPGSRDAVDAAEQIYDLTEHAIAVKTRIRALSAGPIPAPAGPGDDAPPAGECPEELQALLARLRDLPARRTAPDDLN